MLARTACDQQLALWRRSDGAAVAVEDACWHRLMPLSHGRLEGDHLVCKYHGLAFDASGRCTRMPSQEKLNPKACVRSYPAMEKHRLIWVWPDWVSDQRTGCGRVTPARSSRMLHERDTM